MYLIFRNEKQAWSPFLTLHAIDEVICRCNGGWQQLEDTSHIIIEILLVMHGTRWILRIAILRYDICRAKSILSTLFWLIIFFEANIIRSVEEQPNSIQHKGTNRWKVFLLRLWSKHLWKKKTNEIWSLCLSRRRWRWFNFAFESEPSCKAQKPRILMISYFSRLNILLPPSSQSNYSQFFVDVDR